MLPDYWAGACAELSDADPVMAGLIAAYPGASLQSRGDVFGTLARSIVGQQISVKAADSVWARFAERVGEVAPPRLLEVGFEGLEGCGLSQRKREYLLDLAGHFVSGELDPRHWPQSDDAAIIAELTAVRGIGRWTAEMFLIFNLMRPDVYPLDDIGVQRAAGRHYFDRDKATRGELVELGQRWRPWRSVATWYLWRSLDPVPVEY